VDYGSLAGIVPWIDKKARGMQFPRRRAKDECMFAHSEVEQAEVVKAMETNTLCATWYAQAPHTVEESEMELEYE